MDRRGRLIEKIREELGHWRDPEVAGWKEHIDAGDFKAFRDAGSEGFSRLRGDLGTHLVAVANRVAPLRDRSWQWVRPNDSGREGVYRDLVDTGPRLTDKKTWLRGQRGLSLQRIEQLEKG